VPIPLEAPVTSAVGVGEFISGSVVSVGEGWSIYNDGHHYWISMVMIVIIKVKPTGAHP
jgi:hypothetical protein